MDPQRYLTLEDVLGEARVFPAVTVHGRFQPPLHENHWHYVRNAFRIAEYVRILITNPAGIAAPTADAPHRGSAENNPFSYDERVAMFRSFFDAVGIPESRYAFAPFDIVDEHEWSTTLDRDVPNLVNTYGSPWSIAKLSKFRECGSPVIHAMLPKMVAVSGSDIRAILRSGLPRPAMEHTLVAAGYRPEALPGLFAVLARRGGTL